MKMNMGLADRIIRIVLATTVAVLIALNQLSTAAAVVLGALALIFLATGIVGTCPLYMLFGISTKRKAQ